MEVGKGDQSLETRLGLRARGSSSAVTGGGIAVRDNTEGVVHTGRSSGVDLTDATHADNRGSFGVNSLWGSFIQVSGADDFRSPFAHQLAPFLRCQLRRGRARLGLNIAKKRY